MHTAIFRANGSGNKIYCLKSVLKLVLIPNMLCICNREQRMQ